MIARDNLLQQLISRKHNGMIKVITGLRRSGKSFLLFELFKGHLKSEGIDDRNIICVDLEDRRNRELRDPDALLKHIDSRISNSGMHYILLDEIQHVREFEDVLNSYLKVRNADLYVTGSNARFLSRDVLTSFRGRGDEIRVYPLSFFEYFSALPKGVSKEEAFREYMIYGGLPQVTKMERREQKEQYLKNLFTHTYLTDIKERYRIRGDDDLSELVDIIASNIGGLTNPYKIHKTFKSVKGSSISANTIKSYLEYLQDAFLIEKATRYDIKGRKYINTPAKYYFTDVGLRNARLNFRQGEPTHLMENIIYNELRSRGISVDVGRVTINGKDGDKKSVRTTLEVDFVCNMGFKRCYIQSALTIPSPEKKDQELRSLRMLNDEFKKIIIVGSVSPTYQNEDGIIFLNIFDFLLNRENNLIM